MRFVVAGDKFATKDCCATRNTVVLSITTCSSKVQNALLQNAFALQQWLRKSATVLSCTHRTLPILLDIITGISDIKGQKMQKDP